jgi:hypothetical protein
VAGQVAKFDLESANPGGGRIIRGGAHVICTLYHLARAPIPAPGAAIPTSSPAAPAGDGHADATADGSGVTGRRLTGRSGAGINASVKDLQNGVYEVTYTLTRAGPHEVVMTTAGQRRVFQVVCLPGLLDPASCVVDQPDLAATPWTAGELLEVCVRCRDSFGNAVRPPSPREQAAGLVIVADGEGPGMVEADFAPACSPPGAVGDAASHWSAAASSAAPSQSAPLVAGVGAEDTDDPATWSIARFRATVVGEYELRVFASEVQRQWWGGMQRDNLPGAPLKVVLSPAAADHQRSTVTLSGLKERPGGMIVGMAGREATLTVVARDRFNNPSTFVGQRLCVDAVGPADVALQGAGSTPSEQRFTGVIVKSGSYTLRASVAGRSLAGFPRNLQVVAAQTDPMQCQIRGDALAGVVVADSTRASLTAHDRFGNACLEGGDQVMVRMLGPAGSVDAEVVDYGDGTYGLAFTVPRAGEWRAHLAVNGDENPDAVARFTAVQGRLTANQVTLRVSGAGGAGGGGGSAAAAPHVGAETTVYIQALDFEVAGREVGGREPICLRLLSPSGVSANVPLRLSKDRARFRATVRWPEVGTHVLVASLNGDAVVGSPLQVSVVAADVTLPACKVAGAGAGKCVAGERTQFSIEARDSRGNRLLAGGASLTLQVQAPGQEPMRGSVLDQGDGTYTASYAVDQAGPYLLVLASASSRLALEGVCRPGPADVTRCRVDASGLTALTAGARGAMRIVRADRFGNVIPAGPDMLPFRVEAAGVGPAEVETVEAGDGACDVRFEARVAGRYTLHVWSGYARDAVVGSPFDVTVLPGQAASSSCVAHLEGTQMHGPGVTAAIAGEALTVRMQARDRFGNPTAWKRWQTLNVSASGPQEVVFHEAAAATEAPGGSSSWGGVEGRGGGEGGGSGSLVSSRQVSAAQPMGGGRGVFVAQLSRAGAYVVWCTVGGQAVVGWPRVIQVVPGSVEADASVWRAEAETMALTSQLALSSSSGGGGGLALRSAGEVSTLRAEAESLRARLDKYEQAAAVVMEAVSLCPDL